MLLTMKAPISHCFSTCIFHHSGVFHYFPVSSLTDNCKYVVMFTDLNAFALVFLLLRLQREHYKQLLKLLVAVVDAELLKTETKTTDVNKLTPV